MRDTFCAGPSLKEGRFNLDDLDKDYVVIIQHFTQQNGVIHQVTLRRDKVHDGLIRLGETMGDEINGWNYPDNLHIVSVLGEAIQNGDKWECRPILEKAA